MNRHSCRHVMHSFDTVKSVDPRESFERKQTTMVVYTHQLGEKVVNVDNDGFVFAILHWRGRKPTKHTQHVNYVCSIHAKIIETHPIAIITLHHTPTTCKKINVILCLKHTAK